MWKPEVGGCVILTVLGNEYEARVLGMNSYLYHPEQYYIEYIDKQGNPLTSWVTANQLSPQK
jgi:hypothetical protein